MTITPEELAELERAEAEATEGPWYYNEAWQRVVCHMPCPDYCRGGGAPCPPGMVSCGGYLVVVETDGGHYSLTEGNERFIALARNKLPALIKALREAWAEIERLKE